MLYSGRSSSSRTMPLPVGSVTIPLIIGKSLGGQYLLHEDTN